MASTPTSTNISYPYVSVYYTQNWQTILDHFYNEGQIEELSFHRNALWARLPSDFYSGTCRAVQNSGSPDMAWLTEIGWFHPCWGWGVGRKYQFHFRSGNGSVVGSIGYP